MKFVSIVLIAGACALAMAAPIDRPEPLKVEEAPQLFEKFIKEFERNYKDDADRQEHYEAFVESIKRINELNAANTSATFGINNFADFTEKERKNMFGLKLP